MALLMALASQRVIRMISVVVVNGMTGRLLPMLPHTIEYDKSLFFKLKNIAFRIVR